MHDEAPHIRIVIHHQDALAAAGSGLARRHRRRRQRRTRGERQPDLHHRPALRPVRRARDAAALPRNSVHLAQAEARALADRFRGEERIEHLAQQCRRNADTRVGHCDHHIAAGAQILGRSRRHAGGDDQLAAIRHRVACVDGKIEDRQLELIGIRRRAEAGRLQIEPDRDPVANGTCQQIVHPADHVVHHDRPQIELLAAREGEQLAGQPCRTIHRLARIIGHPANALVMSAAADHLDIAENRGSADC